MFKYTFIILLLVNICSCDQDENSNNANNSNNNTNNANNINNTNNANNANNITNNTNNISSTIGECWQQVADTPRFSKRAGHSTVVFNNKMWVMGGFENVDSVALALNDVWSSLDGITWNRALQNAPWAPRVSHCSLVFQEKMWVIGGNMDSDYFSDVWWSDDGITWNIAKSGDSEGFSDRKGVSCLSFNNKIWIIGGVDYGGISQVWTSTDGSDWTIETTPPWDGRGHHVSYVHNNKIWVVGGSVYATEYYQDVWSSSDGINWQKEIDEIGQDTLYGHSAFIGNNRVVITGGNGNSDGVLISDDGTSFTHFSEIITSRSYHTSTWFNNRGWLIGGSYSENMGIALRNDLMVTCP
jgi:leucine-zipper-like transcriptional regulator 1